MKNLHSWGSGVNGSQFKDREEPFRSRNPQFDQERKKKTRLCAHPTSGGEDNKGKKGSPRGSRT